jgi:uncharacterized protein (DUF1800 family)
MSKNKNLHLLWRSGFGPDFSQTIDIETLSEKQLWSKIKINSSKSLPSLETTSSFVKDNYDKITDRKLTKDEKDDWNKRIRFQSAKDLKELNNNWINLMVNSPNQLGEKTSFFWHHHFAIRHANSFLQQDAINIIRKYALGNFGDLLREVSKSGAMILSLNNQQNKKTEPNENFAREIMELFAMGIGNYSEQDIKEAARAFTGWSISRAGRFEFKSENHDTGLKTILGQTGRFNGDDVVDIILKQPETSKFIVSKIYRYFVNGTADNKIIDELSISFAKDYNILNLLDAIFNSDGFYYTANIGCKIKTPVDLLVGVQRLSPFTTIDDNLQSQLQKLLGQVLFHPPSIAGWRTDKNWLDSSTLMVRLQVPQILSGDISISLKLKSNDDVNMGRTDIDDDVKIENRNRLNFSNHWKAWEAQQNEASLSSFMIIPNVNAEIISMLKTKADGNKSAFAISLMSLPEYQLC